MMGRVETARIGEGLQPDEKRTLVFRFPFDFPRPGVYPLVLLSSMLKTKFGSAGVAVFSSLWRSFAAGAQCRRE